MLPFLLDMYLGMEFLGYVMTLPFDERQNYFLRWPHHFILPITKYKGSNFSISSPSLIICLFDYSHLMLVWNGISLWFLFAFPKKLIVLSIFSCADWPFICFFFEKMAIQILAHFYIGLLIKSCDPFQVNFFPMIK